ncbi:ABC-F family ATP-binding cassette domain-containing protein [Eggerthia catenaformis]|uniref:ABC-F family ATP-binding cassette domain-containing protein n=1 Tax=Eggerthia catenaformis TaxID=31973 RepID=UPI0028E79BD6|nr:ABC-F family ATP-binding cassette domain-containing protein [Eggerthia catenaformis]
MILSCSSLTKLYGDQEVLKNITFNIEAKDKLAVIGENGAGKSTLLKILQNEESYDSGTLSIAGDVTIGYLSQDHNFDLSLSIYETLESPYKNLKNIEKRMRYLETQMAYSDHLDSIMKEYDALTVRFEESDGYTIESNIKGILNGLGFQKDIWYQPVSILSGGQKTRIILGQLLLSEPDLLLLDEPTNHLDLEAIEWLENYLKSYPKAIIVVSHDRYFIDQVTDSIMEIENGKSKIYHCHYNEYAQIKKHNRDIDLKHYLDNQKEIKKMQQSIDTLKSFNREKQLKRAHSKEKALERNQKTEKPNSLPSPIHISFQPEIESGYDVLKVKDLSMSFTHPLFDHISFEVKRNDRIALLGPNGIGKTTLFHLILKDLIPDSGHIHLGVKVTIGYYDQEHSSLNINNTIFDEISNSFPKMNNTQIRNICAAFLFKGEDVFKTIDILSGGEKGRIVLMKLLLNKANFLILDEPTNHLDIQSKEVLEDALLDFDGTILFISHDRYFINKIATKILDMSEHGVDEYNGNYSYYLEHLKIKSEQKETAVSQSKIVNQADKALKNKLKKVENEISSLENTIKEKEALLEEEEIINDYEKYNECTDTIEQLNNELEEKLLLWEELNS